MIKMVNPELPADGLLPLAIAEPEALATALIPSYGKEWKIGVLYICMALLISLKLNILRNFCIKLESTF